MVARKPREYAIQDVRFQNFWDYFIATDHKFNLLNNMAALSIIHDEWKEIAKVADQAWADGQANPCPYMGVASQYRKMILDILGYAYELAEHCALAATELSDMRDRVTVRYISWENAMNTDNGRILVGAKEVRLRISREKLLKFVSPERNYPLRWLVEQDYRAWIPRRDVMKMMGSLPTLQLDPPRPSPFWPHLYRDVPTTHIPPIRKLWAEDFE